jgi:hypothetical protein
MLKTTFRTKKYKFEEVIIEGTLCFIKLRMPYWKDMILYGSRTYLIEKDVKDFK